MRLFYFSSLPPPSYPPRVVGGPRCVPPHTRTESCSRRAPAGPPSAAAVVSGPPPPRLSVSPQIFFKEGGARPGILKVWRGQRERGGGGVLEELVRPEA